MYEAKLQKIMEAYEHMGEYPCEIHQTIRVKNIEWDEDDIEECPELEDVTSEEVDVTYTAQYEGDHSERGGKIDNELADNHEGYVPLDYDVEILNSEIMDSDVDDASDANESQRNPFMYPKSYECDVTITDIMWSDDDLEKHPELAEVTDDAFSVEYTMSNEEDDESIGAAIDAKLSNKYYGCVPETYDYEMSDMRTAEDYNESIENPQHGDGFVVVVRGMGLYFTEASFGACRFSSNIDDAHLFDSREEAENMADNFKSLELEVQPA